MAVIKNRCFGIAGLLKDVRGQAMVEFAVCVPVLIILLYACVYMADLYIIEHKTIVSARYGTWRIAKDPSLSAGQIKPDVKKFFFKDYDDDKLQVTFQNVSGGNIEEDIMAFINDIFSGGAPMTYTVKVSYMSPVRLGPLDMSDEFGGGLDIKSRHYVDGNAWDGCHTDVHDVFSLIKSMVTEILESLYSF